MSIFSNGEGSIGTNDGYGSGYHGSGDDDGDGDGDGYARGWADAESITAIKARHALVRIHRCGDLPDVGQLCIPGCVDAELPAGCLHCCFEADPTEGNTRHCFDNHEHTTDPNTRCDVARVLFWLRIAELAVRITALTGTPGARGRTQ